VFRFIWHPYVNDRVINYGGGGKGNEKKRPIYFIRIKMNLREK